MDIEFANTRLKKLCEDRRVATRKLGADSARRLGTRLAEIQSASCVQELFAGRPHPLSGDRQGEFAVSLAGGGRLVFVPNDDPPRVTDTGQVNWQEVSSVKIVFAGDYHE